MMEAKKLPYLSYFIGFLASVLLTMAAYVPVYRHAQSGGYSKLSLTIFVVVLAIIQMFIQLFFFLHLGKEGKPRWRVMAVIFALVIVLIIVIGSLWIMNNLNYRMTPKQMQQYMQSQASGGL